MNNVIIIGAGPAGLTAAYELTMRGYTVTILEADDCVGGISRTVRHNTNRIDIGGHRFFSKDERVMKWWREILPVQGELAKDDKKLGRAGRTCPGGPDPDKTDEVFLIRHRISRIYYRQKFFDYPLSLKPKTFLNMGLLTSFSAGCSYLWSCVHKLPVNSLENFYINRFGKRLYMMFFKGYTTKVWGRSPSEISADWGAQRVKGLSLKELLKNALQKMIPNSKRQVETSLIEEFYYPKYGPGQLWETVAKRVVEGGAKLHYNKLVTDIDLVDTCITNIQCSDGTSYAPDIVFSSMPIKDLIASMKHVPMEISSIANGLPYRDFITVGILVDRLSLKNTTDIPTLGNIVPDCWIYVQDDGVKLGRIQIFNNWSPYMLEDPENTIWLGLEYFCQEGDGLWSLDEKEMTTLATKELQHIGIIDNKATILDTCVEHVRKAYPAYFDTYEHIEDIRAFLDGIDNLYCIGRNGQHRYNNMDHSMATAFVAIDAIDGKASKDELWQVNTEKTYQESKG